MPDPEQLRSYYDAVLPFYEATLRDRGDLPFWTSIARRWSSKSILDLGCGTGRVTSVLSAHAPTVGADLLIEMLVHAKRQVRDARLVALDIRRLALAAAFDLVVLADDPMAHVTQPDERASVLRSIADHMTSDGRLVLEGLYKEAGKPVAVNQREIVREGRAPFTVQECWEPAGDALWNATYRYQEGSTVTEVASLLRSWTIEEIHRLPEAGLEVEELWGDFDERPFADDSPRIVLVARRANLP